MRIARVVTRLNLGGPARQVLASDPLLRARGHEVRVFAGRPEPGEGDLFATLGARGVEVVEVPGLVRGGGPLANARAWRFLARELAAFAPDLVHTHASKAGLLGRTAAPRDAALVHTFHGHVLEDYFARPVSRVIARMERRLARRCARIVAVSAATRDDLVRLGVAPARAIELSPPGLDLAPFLAVDEAARHEARRALGLGPDAFVVAFVGRLAPVKRPHLAGAVLAHLRTRGVDARLVVAGDGPGRADLVRAAGDHAAAVQLLGAVPDPLAVHAACDALVSTSRNEGMPVALIESAATGRPVVATRVGGVAELVEDGVTGRLVDAGSPVEALADALGLLARDATGRARMGAAARARVAQRHDAPALADRLERIYRRALADPTARVEEVDPCVF